MKFSNIQLIDAGWDMGTRRDCMNVRMVYMLHIVFVIIACRHMYVPLAYLDPQLYLTANYQILDIVYVTRHKSLKSEVE